MWEIIRVAVSLAGVLGLIMLLFVGLRMLNKRVSVIGGSRLRILDRANLGRDSMILVVSVGGKLMVVGVSSQRVEKISDLDMTEEEYVAALAPGVSGNTPTFSDILGNIIGKKKSVELEIPEDTEKNEEDS